MFTRIGTPVTVEAVAFDSSKAVDVFCKCSSKVGQRCGGVFAAAGAKPQIITSDFAARCASCGETNHV